MIGSTCFGHCYAHHQELATVMLITTLVISFLVCRMLEVRCGWAGVVSRLQAEARLQPATPRMGFCEWFLHMCGERKCISNFIVLFHKTIIGTFNEKTMRTLPSEIQHNIRMLSQSTSGCQCDGVLSAEDRYGHICGSNWLLLMLQNNITPSTNCYWRNAKHNGEPVGYHRNVRYFISVNFPTKWKVSILVISETLVVWYSQEHRVG